MALCPAHPDPKLEVHPMILVTGATGTIGSHLVPSLLDQDAPVRVLVRDADKARASFGHRVDIVSGDLRDASSVSVALKGVDTVFLNSPSLDGRTSGAAVGGRRGTRRHDELRARALRAG